MSRTLAVIPARMGSTRFPGKALAEHRGRPLIYYVWSRVRKARLVDRVMIATDSKQIAKAAERFGAEAVLTSRRARTGTDRVAEAAGGLSAGIVINVQGDTFNLSPGALDRVVKQMQADPKIRYATLAARIQSDRDLFDPNKVKVVVSADGRALWFSRFPLPYLQRPEAGERAGQFRYLGHLGVYFFRKPALMAFAGWKQTDLEKAESLEQLRILENGGQIQVFQTRANTVSIDTPADIAKITG